MVNISVLEWFKLLLGWRWRTAGELASDCDFFNAFGLEGSVCWREA